MRENQRKKDRPSLKSLGFSFNARVYMRRCTCTRARNCRWRVGTFFLSFFRSFSLSRCSASCAWRARDLYRCMCNGPRRVNGSRAMGALSGGGSDGGDGEITRRRVVARRRVSASALASFSSQETGDLDFEILAAMSKKFAETVYRNLASTFSLLGHLCKAS